jgi:hypothetical protein
MGMWTFAAHRVIDIFVPGAGLVMDALDAIELIEVHVLSCEVFFCKLCYRNMFFNRNIFLQAVLVKFLGLYRL